MQSPIRLTGSLRIQARLTQWAHLGILAGLGILSFIQARALLKSPRAATSSPANITAQSMQARLSGVSAGLTSYLQNHNTDSLDQIKSEGKEASRLLGDLKDESLRIGKSAISARVEKAHEELREATVDLLAVDHTVLNNWQALHQSSDALMAILTGQMEASIKPDQGNASARHRAVRTAIEEAKTLSSIREPGSELDASRARFRRALVTYEELSRTRRAGQWADEARTLIDQMVKGVRELQQTERQKQAAVDRYTEKRNVLKTILQENYSAATRGAKFPVYFFMILAGALLVSGIAIVFWSHRRTETQLVGPVQDILQCVEAASTGDVSRIPDYWSRDEMGQLAQAVGRLITVLARSENLVYHLAALVDGSGEAIISHTLDGTILSWNKGAQRIYGYSADEVKGRSIAILSPEDEGSELMRNLQKIRRGERIQPFETLHQARNGRRVQALVRVSAILDSTRKVIGASFCAQDLTDTQLTRQKANERSSVS